jgi:hypothetical protein
MGELSGINGIGKTSLELLEAVGIGSTEELAAQDADSLAHELGRANETLAINKRAPTKSAVGKWIAAARRLAETNPGQERQQKVPERSAPVNYEANPEVAEMLSRAPCAIPLPGRVMMEEGLAVADVTPGLLLNRYSGDLEVRVGGSTGSEPVISAPRPSGNVETIEMNAGRRHFTASPANLIPLSTPGGGKRLPKSRNIANEDRISQIRAPHEETNRGKDPGSRSFIRGVLHIHPWGLRIGALFSLLLLVNVPLAIIAALFLILSREYPQTFQWVPEWFLAFPAALPLLGLACLFWALPGKCRVCTHKLFVHNRARKHIRAHHVPGLGYVIPLCLHLLWFSWFRCPSCGTPLRLKK